MRAIQTPYYQLTLTSLLKMAIVNCELATKWRKRYAFTPIEYEFLSNESKSKWKMPGTALE